MTPFKTITEKLSAWRRYRDAVRELTALSDRELEDIGIRRGDIPTPCGSTRIRDAFNTFARFRNGSPMPIITTFMRVSVGDSP